MWGSGDLSRAQRSELFWKISKIPAYSDVDDSYRLSPIFFASKVNSLYVGDSVDGSKIEVKLINKTGPIIDPVDRLRISQIILFDTRWFILVVCQTDYQGAGRYLAQMVIFWTIIVLTL